MSMRWKSRTEGDIRGEGEAKEPLNPLTSLRMWRSRPGRNLTTASFQGSCLVLDLRDRVWDALVVPDRTLTWPAER